MSDGQAWGMCAAYGCPLLGSVGADGRWYCFCHAGRPSSANDAITARLRSGEYSPIVQATLDIRRCFSAFRDQPDAYRQIQHRFVQAGRRDLLLGEADCSPERPGQPIVKQWLARLERHLIEATSDLGQQQLPTNLVPTAAVIGPTHAMQHYTDAIEKE